MVKSIKKIPITQVAKALGIPAKDLIEKCISEGFEGVTSPQSSIPIEKADELAEKSHEWFPRPTTTSGTETHSLNFVDGTSTHFVCQEITKRKGEKVTLDFKELSRCLSGLRRNAGWKQHAISMVFLAVNVENKSQLSYKKALEDAKMEVDITDYRALYPFVPSGSPAAGGTRGDTPQPSLSARISYAIGLQARHNALDLMVLSHDYALCSSLKDLAERNPKEFNIGLVFFSSLLEDPRWKSSGVLNPASSPVKCFDLDPHAQKLLGIDLRVEKHEAPTQSPKRNGLARL